MPEEAVRQMSEHQYMYFRQALRLKEGEEVPQRYVDAYWKVKGLSDGIDGGPLSPQLISLLVWVVDLLPEPEKDIPVPVVQKRRPGRPRKMPETVEEIATVG